MLPAGNTTEEAKGAQCRTPPRLTQPPDASVSRMCRAQTLPPQVSATIMPWMMIFDAFSKYTLRKIAVSAKLPAESITRGEGNACGSALPAQYLRQQVYGPDFARG